MRISDWSSDVCSSDLGAGLQSLLAVEHAVDGLIAAEVMAGIDLQKVGQPVTAAIHAALHGPDGTAADVRRVFIRKSGRADPHQGFTLLRPELPQRPAAVLPTQRGNLVGLGGQLGRM